MNTPSFELKNKFNSLLSSRTPLLSGSVLTDFIAPFFRKRKTYLEAAARHGSPLYIQEPQILRARAQSFIQAFEKTLPNPAFYFAVKSNNHPGLAKVLLEEGFGLDVSSGLELKTALSLEAGAIIFSGPGKTEKELRSAVHHSDRVVVLMDSFGELEKLASVSAELSRTVRCGVRITVNPTGLWRKFGINIQRLPDFWAASKRCPHIHLAGLQFHSSWNLTPHHQAAFIETLGKAIGAMPSDFRSQLEFIDIGGGYWPPQGEWLQPAGTPEGVLLNALGKSLDCLERHYRIPSEAIENFALAIGEALEKHLFPNLPAPCRIWLEPGRWICNDAVHLLLTVVDKKADDLVITDAGTNAVGWERFESDYFPILNLSAPSLTEHRCDVLGSLCTPRDVWGYMYFGDRIAPGDILLIPTQGAYTYSLRQNFIKPLPDVCQV